MRGRGRGEGRERARERVRNSERRQRKEEKTHGKKGKGRVMDMLQAILTRTALSSLTYFLSCCVRRTFSFESARVRLVCSSVTA
jgi:hypothetical protein